MNFHGCFADIESDTNLFQSRSRTLEASNFGAFARLTGRGSAVKVEAQQLGSAVESNSIYCFWNKSRKFVLLGQPIGLTNYP